MHPTLEDVFVFPTCAQAQPYLGDPTSEVSKSIVPIRVTFSSTYDPKEECPNQSCGWNDIIMSRDPEQLYRGDHSLFVAKKLTKDRAYHVEIEILGCIRVVRCI
jgi:hypothetical protein